ncbi:MAG: PLD nuclease N-terminal domain-containing protein [Candidatus Peregrinibacteria bacterium]|nr:PLD nuclease N-terminal domain-containing protein [Candidatus Peregrinibacteria bacterium]
MSSLQAFLASTVTLVSDDPWLRTVQLSLLGLGSVLVFLVFYATKDILLRTRSFPYQCGSILLVAALPMVGFLLYLLIRPARTIKERELETMLRRLLAEAKKDDVLEKKKHQNPSQGRKEAEKGASSKESPALASTARK